ncbi:HAD family hydrolase [Dehalobacterium formicoaceticum]|uniref:HAD family phosphatase n=1 Tax=Dehalobacterium formicoaceticum TaxID=51515 RepID=A0ABT1Y5Q0_9FIRM|nr:HAD family phosphatase [Dehalobacterium formicoaceticum]MCR6546215.1 HAD family phosphatase [Dehalobacterium formicoaceticum]
MKIKYAIFDLDGTLIDSMEFWGKLGNEILAYYEIVPPENLSEILMPMNTQQMAEYLKEKFSLPLSVQEIIWFVHKKVEEKYKHEIPLKPNVREFLEKLKSDKVKMGIATANDYSTTRDVLLRLGIGNHFDFILTCSDVGYSKESPQIYYAAAEKLGCHPKEAVVFEDCLTCIKTAKNAGFCVVGVADKYSVQNKGEIQTVCDYYINSYAEI